MPLPRAKAPLQTQFHLDHTNRSLLDSSRRRSRRRNDIEASQDSIQVTIICGSTGSDHGRERRSPSKKTALSLFLHCQPNTCSISGSSLLYPFAVYDAICSSIFKPSAWTILKLAISTLSYLSLFYQEWEVGTSMLFSTPTSPHISP
ncbi:hypothetical protein KP509_12G067700 [Ceratopteris richardii]|uniref:Uncharacterized protein n=1 Tax=Ceratopteris richardii TaxID=49495 RepID=A0A8T2TMN9_CERRI|nr:hypothetical protein KP509_12G067700 [Ceratopteris richardii]